MSTFGCWSPGFDPLKDRPLELLSGSNLLSLLGIHPGANAGGEADAVIDGGMGVRHPVPTTAAETVPPRTAIGNRGDHEPV